MQRIVGHRTVLWLLGLYGPYCLPQVVGNWC